MRWSTVSVDGSPVRYVVSGYGPPALFLHGWGLRPNAYANPIRHMGLAGCRVLAPTLPGFGGTPELPVGQRSFGGYSTWVGRFLDAVGEREMALVAGHSFGGGVAISFVHNQPFRTRALLLANAVGSPIWGSGRAGNRGRAGERDGDGVPRSLAAWGRSFGSDLLHSSRPSRVFPVLFADFATNLVANPVGMFRTGGPARRADLVAEMRTVAAGQTSITMVWSDRDGLVPRAAFDDLRRAAGVDGLVVEGSHGWLIAHPDRFGQVVTYALAESGALVPPPTPPVG